ncbi:MAG: hypothetical protein CV090_15550 [Nitrospira sp. WS238]|nr:hypothetical protein [Nitrospira sp. WS238]
MTTYQSNDPIQDFDIRYQFLTEQEGGRTSGLPFQGYRCDWAYDGDDINETGLWMIWPFFEDERGCLVEMGKRVSMEGIARLVVVNPAMWKEVHSRRINIGVKGYLMEGRKRVAEGEVIRVTGLYGE